MCMYVCACKPCSNPFSGFIGDCQPYVISNKHSSLDLYIIVGMGFLGTWVKKARQVFFVRMWTNLFGGCDSI